MIRIVINGQDNITVNSRERTTLIQVQPNYASGCINREFKYNFSTLILFSTVVQRGYIYLIKPAASTFCGRCPI